MNVDTDLVLLVAWIILALWAMGLAALLVVYRRMDRSFERDLDRHHH